MRHWFRMRYVVWALLGLSVIVSFFVYAEREEQDYAHSAQRGMQWLQEYDRAYENPGVLWVLDDINSTYCKSDLFASELKERLLETHRTPVEHAYASFLSFSDSPTTTLPAVIDGAYDRWLLFVLSCGEDLVPEEVYNEIMDVERATGYDLTHKYLALTYLLKSSCEYDRLAVLQAKDKAALTILTEAKEQEYQFSDLLAEQAAFLQWGGDGFLLPSEMVASIERAQWVSGGWAGAQGEERENLHTSALATWFMTQKSKTCPLSANGVGY